MSEFISSSEKETKEIAENLGKNLKAGDVVLICGALGSGKTIFVKGLARGLGIDENLVSSPTFTIMNIYSGENLLFHLDLYRIEHEEELNALGIEDFLDMGILAVEWGEKAEDAPWANTSIKVFIDQTPDDKRKIRIEP